MDQQVQTDRPYKVLAERLGWVAGLVATFAGTYAYNRPTTPPPPESYHQAERVEIIPQAAPVVPQRPVLTVAPERPALVGPVLEEKPVIRVDTLLIEAKEIKLVGAVSVNTPEIKLPAVYVKNELPPEVIQALLKQPVVQVVNPQAPAPIAEVLPQPTSEPRAATVVDPPIPPLIKAPARVWPARRE